jgi:hypothetical protein
LGVGAEEGLAVGDDVGVDVGAAVGAGVGAGEGLAVGEGVGAAINTAPEVRVLEPRETVYVTSASVLTPGATSWRLQVTNVSEIHCVDAQIVEPTATVEDGSEEPKLRPVTDMTLPPVVGWLYGKMADVAGASYENNPSLVDAAESSVIVTSTELESPAGTPHVTDVPETHMKLEHGADPNRAYQRLVSYAPKLVPTRVTLAPPVTGPLRGLP